jgi:hypothetical protein
MTQLGAYKLLVCLIPPGAIVCDDGSKMLQERTMTKYFNLLVLKHVMYEHQNTLSSYVNVPYLIHGAVFWAKQATYIGLI